MNKPLVPPLKFYPNWTLFVG